MLAIVLVEVFGMKSGQLMSNISTQIAFEFEEFMKGWVQAIFRGGEIRPGNGALSLLSRSQSATNIVLLVQKMHPYLRV